MIVCVQSRSTSFVASCVYDVINTFQLDVALYLSVDLLTMQCDGVIVITESFSGHFYPKCKQLDVTMPSYNQYIE